MPQLQQRLDTEGRDGVGEQRPQASGLDKVRLGPGQVAEVQASAWTSGLMM
jgi:hypothetical protein